MRYFLGLLLLSSISSCFPTLSTARHLTSEQEGNGAQQQGVFLTREDNASALPRINPAFLGDEGSDGIHGWSTRDSLKYHDLQEKRIRTLLEEKIGRWPSRGQARLFGQARFQSMIREDFGPYGFERWVKYTDAMKTLLANDKCGPVWNQATNMYYVCCVFRVGLEDDTGYTYVLLLTCHCIHSTFIFVDCDTPVQMTSYADLRSRFLPTTFHVDPALCP